MLYVKILDPLATTPTVAHPGEDLGYDLYAKRIVGQPLNSDGTPATFNPPSSTSPHRIDNTGKVVRPIRIEAGRPTLVETGVALHFANDDGQYGLLLRDRSSLATKGLFVTAGVIDSGYRGEIKVIFNLTGGSYFDLWPGDKIAQVIPIKVLTGDTKVVPELEDSSRKDDSFGSSGQ